MFASSLSVMMQTERLMRRRITGAESAGHASMVQQEIANGLTFEI
jgi:hypothetical protein